MNNKILNYLLNNNPNKVLSKNGIRIRKLINPLFRKTMMLSTTGKLKIVRKGIIPADKKIIFAGTHGFHDDIIFTMKTINKHVYLLYGSLLDFYQSFHGLGLWVNGVILVDRKVKKSRQSAIDKMVKASELGTDILMFPEGTWNKNESIPVQKLYPGIYEVAEKSGAWVVPIATVLDGNVCYSLEGDAYDITNINSEMVKEIINRQIKKIIKSKDLLIYSNNNEKKVVNLLENLLSDLSKEDLSTKSEKELLNIVDYISRVLKEVLLVVNEISLNVEQESIYKSIFERVSKILKTAINQKKLYAVEILRDKMCTLKWSVYKKSENNFESDYWGKYIDELIASTNGLYDHEIEDVAEYKDPDEINDYEVFKVLDDVQETKENAKVLSLTKNKKENVFI